MTRSDKARRWQQHIDAWRQGGQSQRGYCAQAGISFSNFSYWRAKLKGQSAGSGNWVSLPLSSSRSVVVASLPGGVRLEIPVQCVVEVLPVICRAVGEVS